MERNIVVDVPHDGTAGFHLAEDYLAVDEKALSGGRDFGAREIFLGHDWALQEVVGECYRDLMDLNRLPRDSSDDGRFKKYGMCLDGQPPGTELWKTRIVPGPLKIELQDLGQYYKRQLTAALNDTRARLVLFGHTMPHLASGSSTSELEAGEPNALVSIGNGGNKNGEGDNLLLPAEQARYFKTQIEQWLSKTLGDDTLHSYTGESGKVVSLNDYAGTASARRHKRTHSRDLPSVLIEFNRSLIGHPDDPLFAALQKQGISLFQYNRQAELHTIIHKVMQAYQQRFLVD